MIILAVIVSFFEKKKSRLFSISVRLVAITGLIWILISSTPLPSIIYWLIAIGLGFVIFLHRVYPDAFPGIVECLIKIMILLLCVIWISLELPNWIVPSVAKNRYKKLIVIGDSISAGIGFHGEKTWIECIREKYGIETVSISMGGGQIEDAIRMSLQIKDQKAFILFEIGGNDIFKDEPVEKIEKSLELLLEKTCAPERTIAMLELPLPPFHADICRIQRKLAKKYGVILIPKRYFAKILSGKDSTVDGLHLSNFGHEKMAETLWPLIKDAFEPTS